MISAGLGPPDMAMLILLMVCLWCARPEGRTLRRSRPVPAIDLPTAPASPGAGRSPAPPRHAAAYLLAADNCIGPLLSRLRGTQQPVVRPRHAFSAPRSHLLARL